MQYGISSADKDMHTTSRYMDNSESHARSWICNWVSKIEGQHDSTIMY
jgi:hypothetical protein